MPDKHPLDQMPVTAGFTLATLAADTGLVVTNTTAEQNYKAVSLHAVWGIDILDAADGPLLFGVADGEISLAKLEEYLEALITDSLDIPQSEQVTRPVQVLGALGHDLKTVYQKDRILLPTFRENQGFVVWVYNGGIAMTTGSSIRMTGRFFGRWLD